ncbi:MAG: hypothetical protein HY720_04215 [Planctomycetes bacterium]|nr:hypothetical protein [Planctomycetota bacterium]
MERRRFFEVLAREAVAFVDELRGIPQLPLADLWRLSDDDLARIIAQVIPGVEIMVEDRHIGARRQGSAETIVLFDDELANTVAFNGFNGRTTIGEVARQVASAMSWDHEQAFLYTKELFLRLVERRVCVPANTIEYGPR